jgi:predicted transcriptional regulator
MLRPDKLYPIFYSKNISCSFKKLKYRCSVDIIAKILDAALCGESKSKIMMHAHLNHIQIKRYIPHVLSEQLMEKRSNPINSSFLYATTEKGRIFLQKYEKVQLNQIE